MIGRIVNDLEAAIGKRSRKLVAHAYNAVRFVQRPPCFNGDVFVLGNLPVGFVRVRVINQN